VKDFREEGLLGAVVELSRGVIGPGAQGAFRRLLELPSLLKALRLALVSRRMKSIPALSNSPLSARRAAWLSTCALISGVIAKSAIGVLQTVDILSDEDEDETHLTPSQRNSHQRAQRAERRSARIGVGVRPPRDLWRDASAGRAG